MKSHFASIGKPTLHIKPKCELFYFHAWLLIWHWLFNVGIVICATVCFDGLQIIDFWPGVTHCSGFCAMKFRLVSFLFICIHLFITFSLQEESTDAFFLIIEFPRRKYNCYGKAETPHPKALGICRFFILLLTRGFLDKHHCISAEQTLEHWTKESRIPSGHNQIRKSIVLVQRIL